MVYPIIDSYDRLRAEMRMIIVDNIEAQKKKCNIKAQKKK
jgi:hypothetical protein